MLTLGATSVSSPTLRGNIRYAATPALPAGTERYPIAGGGAIVVPVYAGDILRIVDVEGSQAAELVGFVDGRPDPEFLGTPANGNAAWLKSVLAGDDMQALRLRTQLAKHGCSLDGARSIDLLGPGSRAGEEARTTMTSDGICVISAPGGPMAVDRQDPPTELVVFVEHKDPSRLTRLEDHGELPEPLGRICDELRIDRCTARAYEVKKGQWIQVIDVEGRQCSDFQAFRASALDKGLERCIDTLTTRTLMGRIYPRPGQHSKYYDTEMQPLVQLVHDNCQRHDTFALACNSKMYEEMGYFGHVNCTDNYNAELQPYGIKPRRGWMAMNFFFNSAIDESNVLTMDEPWSRAGDYILMQALEDLVCVSSACPDDIDPANGWNPTDIHVRIYNQDLEPGISVGFRKRPDSGVEMTRESGFHARTSALTRDFADVNGYWLPSRYTATGAIDEYWACREKAVVMDLSALRKFEILGPDAESLLQFCLPRDVRRLSIGRVTYSPMCDESGTMKDDGTLFRLGPDNFRWICGTDLGGEWLREQAERLGCKVLIKTSTNELHNLSVQGPNSRDILRKFVWTRPDQPDMEELRLFRFAIARLHHEDGTPFIVSRTGYTGELGYELFCHPKDAVELWDAVWEAGQSYGLTPMGLEALDMVRIEAGLVFAGHEFDNQTDPFEAGIGFTIPLESKTEEFIGREALARRKQTPQRRLVGLELDGNEVAGHGDPVYIGRHQVGVVTSGTRSPILHMSIALCRVAVEYTENGTEVEIGKLDGQQKRLPAVVVPVPHYDPEKKRLRS